MQEINDKILVELRNVLSEEELDHVDKAISKVLSDYEVFKPNRLPMVVTGMHSEVMEYLVRKRSQGLKRKTLEQYYYVLSMFDEYTNKPIAEIKDWDIIRFLDMYEDYRNIGKRRKESMRVILCGFFRYAVDTGKISLNPMITISRINFKAKLREPLSPIEFEYFREATTNLRDKALVEFLFSTGCRVSEVISLNKRDVDFTTKKIKVLGKGDKERYVFLNAPAYVALKKYLDSREDDNEALFVSIRKPYQRLKKNAVEKTIRTIGKRAGIDRRVFPHLIRHTTATFLYQHNMGLENLQIYLGHACADTTRIYAKEDINIVQHAYNCAI